MAIKKTTTKSTKKTEEKVVETKVCICCGETKPDNEGNSKFYKHKNRLLHDNFGICKQCIEEIGLKEDMKEVHRLLRLMDLPFIPSKWEACSSSANTLTTYIGSGKGLSNPKTIVDGKRITEMRYEDSADCNQVEDVVSYVMASDSERLENATRWGEHYTPMEHHKMNNSVENNVQVTGRDDYHSLKNFERVARAEVERDRAYADNKLKPSDKKTAEDNVSNMMKQAGLSSESSGKSDTNIMDDIKYVVENFEPIPVPSQEYQDVDYFGQYIDRFFLKSAMRAMGKDNSPIKDDYEEIKKQILEARQKYMVGSGE